MKNGFLEQFLDTGWYSESTLFYKGFAYWCEGYWDDKTPKKFFFFVYKFPAKIIDNIYVTSIDGKRKISYVFKIESENIDNAKEKFLEAKIFNGHSFWEIEEEIAWYDEI